jgi:putative FmdB family regulatory protein
MATYEYRCRPCSTEFELRRPMSESDSPARCPDGHADTVRLLSVFASVGSGSPASSEVAAGPCGAGCACYPD